MGINEEMFYQMFASAKGMIKNPRETCFFFLVIAALLLTMFFYLGVFAAAVFLLKLLLA